MRKVHIKFHLEHKEGPSCVFCVNPVSEEGPLCFFILNPVRPDEVVDGGDDDVDDGDRCEDKNSRYVEKETEQKGTFDNFHSYRTDHSLRPLRVKH